MIIVKNRELLIPNNERYIGTTYDNDTENRVFQVPRFSQRGVDLANLTFRLDIQYANEAFDTVVLGKEVGETFIILIWKITSATLQVPGTLYIGIRAVDSEATVKWSSFSAAMYAERHLNTPGNYTGNLTEIEQMEQDHVYMKGVVDELKSNLDYAHDAEAWAQGTRSGAAVPSTDKTYHKNSKYYSEQASAKATQAANSATAAANSATQAAETVTDTNTRFNNAVAAVTVNTEVQDARVGADGTQYTVLKARLDAEHTDVKSHLVEISDNLGCYDYGTVYNTLDPTYNRVMAIFPILNVNDTFYYRVTDKGTNGTLSVRVCSNPTPYSVDLLQSVGAMATADTDLSGSFTINDSVKASAKYILFLNATANLQISFNVALWTEDSVTGELKKTSEIADFLNAATRYTFGQYVQGGVNGITGADAPSNATVRPDGYFPVTELVSAELGDSTGLHIQLYSYSVSMSYLGRNDLGASAFSLSAKQLAAYRNAAFVRFAIYLDGGGNFSPDDLENNGGFTLTLTSISVPAKMNENTDTKFSDLLKSIGKTPMATWVDDDGVVVHTNGGISGVVVPVAEAVGIPVTFGLIPPLTDSVTVDGVTMTKAEYFQQLQKKGHQMAAHPDHTYWYGSQYDLTKVNPTLIECLTELQSYNFLHSDMLIYPGSSGTNADVVEIVRKWCECGVLSGYGTPNHLGNSTRWGIKRTFVNFEDYNSLHSGDVGYVSAMAWYKSQIDDAYSNGDWIIFGTHSYQFTESGDTSNPNANTKGNLQMLMQYAVDKGLEFRTLWDAYNRRKYLFVFNEINQ